MSREAIRGFWEVHSNDTECYATLYLRAALSSRDAQADNQFVAATEIRTGGYEPDGDLPGE
jgi:hypothetical protein